MRLNLNTLSGRLILKVKPSTLKY